jgi:hypothetical protein
MNLEIDSAHLLSQIEALALISEAGPPAVRRGSVGSLRAASNCRADITRRSWKLHIEQGPLLEHERVPLGVVTKIAAPASARVCFVESRFGRLVSNADSANHLG